MDLFGLPHNRTSRGLFGLHRPNIAEGKNTIKYERRLAKYHTKMRRRRKDRARIPKINAEWQKLFMDEKPKIVTFNDHIDVVTIESENKGRKIKRKKKGGYQLYFPTAW